MTSLFLSAVLVAPVMLYRVIQIVAEGMQQPEVVEQECQQRAHTGNIDIAEVIVVAAGQVHQSELHQESQYTCRYCDADLLIDLAVMRQSCLGVIKDEDQTCYEVEYKVADKLGIGDMLQCVDAQRVVCKSKIHHNSNHDCSRYSLGYG